MNEYDMEKEPKYTEEQVGWLLEDYLVSLWVVRGFPKCEADFVQFNRARLKFLEVELKEYLPQEVEVKVHT